MPYGHSWATSLESMSFTTSWIVKVFQLVNLNFLIKSLKLDLLMFGRFMQDDYKRMLQSAMARIDRGKLSLDEVQIHYDAAVKASAWSWSMDVYIHFTCCVCVCEKYTDILCNQAVETSIKDKAYKLSYIANPANGSGFFQILYNLDWNSRGLAVTEDKLQMIASSTIGPTK